MSTIVNRPCCTSEIAVNHRVRIRLRWRVFRFLPIASLLAFNLWWYNRVSRSTSNDETVSLSIRVEQYVNAERALHDRLRKSRRDSQAQMMLARVLAAQNDFRGCARALDEIPFWSLDKPEALLREGQSYLSINRARDAEWAFLEVLKDDPLHPISPALHHDASQELLKIYAIEDRWDDAYSVIWRAYDRGKSVDRLALLSMRLRPELERVSHGESSAILRRYIAAQFDDWDALLGACACAWGIGAVQRRRSSLSDLYQGSPG